MSRYLNWLNLQGWLESFVWNKETVEKNRCCGNLWQREKFFHSEGVDMPCIDWLCLIIKASEWDSVARNLKLNQSSTNTWDIALSYIVLQLTSVQLFRVETFNFRSLNRFKMRIISAIIEKVNLRTSLRSVPLRKDSKYLSEQREFAPTNQLYTENAATHRHSLCSALLLHDSEANF